MPSDASSSIPLRARSGFRNAAIAFATLCCIAFVGGEVAAQHVTDAQRSAIRSACRGDFTVQCAGVKPGGRDALACLQQHAFFLSEGCQQALAEATGGGAGATTPPGDNPSSSTATPAPAPEGAPTMSPREEMAIAREACGADFRAHCRAVPLGRGRGIACLRDNMERLSPGCRKALNAGR